jgi:Ca2+-binding RTX toxin-like protein
MLLIALLALADCGPSNSGAASQNKLEQKMASITVTNQTELTAAIAAAQSGDTIYLAPGNYAEIRFKNKTYAGSVTITSLDPANPAHVDKITVTSSNGLSFKNLDVGYTLAEGEPLFATYAYVTKSSRISFDSMSFHGSLDNYPGNDGNGLIVQESDQIRVINSTFQQLGRGAQFGSTTRIELINNVFHDMRSDGADFAQVQHVRVIGNRFYDFYPEGADHPDAIQFFTSGTTASSSDILIRDNEIFQGNGRGIQGIFLRNGSGSYPFIDVKIINNLIYVVDSSNGLAVLNGRNVTVEGNTVLSPDNNRYTNFIRLDDVIGGKVANNVSDAISDTRNSGVTFTNNIRLDRNPERAADYPGLNDYAAATVAGLISDSGGYQPRTTVVPAEPARWGTPGNDGFYLGANLDPTDVIDGLAGNDQVAIQGHYGNLLLGAESLLNIEVLVLLAGNDTRFGDTSNSVYSYNITTVDENVASGATLIVNSNQLRAGENFTLNGSAETNGAFIVYAGKGDDRLTGGAGNDAFFFGDGAFTGADRIDGGSGNDQVAYRGNFGAVIFSDDTVRNVESLALISGNNTRFGALASGYSYDITLADGNVAAGARLIVTGVELLSDESMRIDASAETNGFLRLLGGKGADILIGGACADFLYGNLGADRLTGGGGADIFHYRTAPESTGSAFDSLVGFDCREDRIDLPVDLAGFSNVVMGGRLSAATMETDLDAALDGLLGAGEAALFTPNAGDMAGRMFVVVDMDGVAGYDAGNDLLIELVNPVVPLPLGVDIFV